MNNKEIKVETKIGMLIAEEIGDQNFPAIGIYLDNGVEKVLLSTTEVDQTDKEALLRTFVYSDREFGEPTEEVRFDKSFYAKSYSINLETLFKSIEKEKGSSSLENEVFVNLTYGKIRKTIDSDTEYYDFVNKFGEIPCMTEETCIVLEITEDFVFLMQENEKIPFRLSKEEFRIAGNPIIE